MSRPLARDALTIFVDGEEVPGLIAYGLREPGLAMPAFPSDAWIAQPEPQEFTLHGDRWEVVGWEIPVVIWPEASRLEGAVRATLDTLTQAGCRVAWIGAEGVPFCDPPDLFNPNCMSGSVLAWATDAGQGEFRIDPDAPVQPASDDRLESLRHHGSGLADVQFQDQVPVVAMSDLQQEVATIRALRHLDLVEPSAVVAWARAATTRGDSTKGIVDLAELSDARGEDVDAHVTALADEIGLVPLTEQVAGVVAAEHVARELTRGTVAPIDAARRIWGIARLAPSAEPRLRVFIGLASEWEDDPDNRTSYEEEIRSEALNLAGWSE
ncbi:hypothetical protein AB0E63_42880 [Kribbella sp. NPDC026596]|uniref:hypothetical protein n=1 Tax=Kribbella sp. NPDC026596 TaxID=3155122 RepID=UPI0033D4A573